MSDETVVTDCSSLNSPASQHSRLQDLDESLIIPHIQFLSLWISSTSHFFKNLKYCYNLLKYSMAKQNKK